MQVVLVKFRDKVRRDFPLTEAATVLGRHSECNLRVPTKDISRKHCEIRIDDDGVFVKDLDSTNGTYVNGDRVAESKLNAGDQLSIGPVSFVVQIDGMPEEIKPADAKPMASAMVDAIEPDEGDTEQILDLDDLELEADEDPMSAVEAILDLDDDDEDDEDAV